MASKPTSEFRAEAVRVALPAVCRVSKLRQILASASRR